MGKVGVVRGVGLGSRGLVGSGWCMGKVGVVRGVGLGSRGLVGSRMFQYWFGGGGTGIGLLGLGREGGE